MLSFAWLARSTWFGWLAALILGLGWGGVAEAEPPLILVTTQDARRAVQGLAESFAEVAVLRIAGDGEEGYDQLNERAWKFRHARLLVASPTGQEVATDLWNERFAGHGVPIVHLTDRTPFPVGIVTGHRLTQLHRALVAAFPEYRPQLDHALQRELQRFNRAIHAEQWVRKPASLPRIGSLRPLLAIHSSSPIYP